MGWVTYEPKWDDFFMYYKEEGQLRVKFLKGKGCSSRSCPKSMYEETLEDGVIRLPLVLLGDEEWFLE